MREVREVKSLKDYTKIIVETDEENPVTIAEITSEEIHTADGYRVRLTPDYSSEEPFVPMDSDGTKYSPQSISIPFPLESHK